MVQRIICEKTSGATPTAGMQAAHSCGNGHLGCVNPSHLSWKTRTANADDKRTHGTATSGERNGGAKLTADDVQKIRSLQGKLTQREIAALFGVGQSTISMVHSGAIWSAR